MECYLLFVLNAGFLIHRLARSKKWGERTVLTALSLFLLLTFAVHPWISKGSWALALLERAVLFLNLFWLAGGPLFVWIEKRRRRRNLFQLLRNGRGPLGEILSACRMLSEAGRGALIAIQRKDPLDPWIQSGVSLDAQIRKETIFSIFTPPGALHDGGMMIQGDRMASAGVLFPLSKRLDLPTELGTRHRAGLGLSEVTDALVIIVSEETGKISLAVGAKLLYDVRPERLAEVLEASLKSKSPRRRQKTSGPKPPLPSPEPALR